ncbi:thioredoxin family protein [Clostridium vincentii]|uniref:Thioredoxin n=1 Tax=Clostridium vincentii TaxID=52704 RepID=A0A2T0B5T6_9CLOT|nr:thioredoxin family protein [Clostridium vincentii]PRR79232.1 Thioredoxin [Clostridium vincentii]
MAITELNNENLKSEIESQEVVLIEFYANWCNACKQLIKVLEIVAKENLKVKFYKINTEENKALCREHKILSLPTFLIFKNSEIVEKVNGFKPKQEIEELLANY